MTVFKLIKRSSIFLLTAATAIAGVEHRQSDLTVEARSLNGEILEGATVTVEMLNHDFRFGTAVTAAKLEPGHPEYDAWTATEIDKYFNSVTFGNMMKWSYYEERTEERMLDIVGFAQEHKGFGSTDQMRMRGHVTVWGSEYQVPDNVIGSNNGTYVHDRIMGHITDYHTTFKDSGIKNFDLYNEHFHKSAALIDKIVTGKELELQAAEVAQWFNAAKAADPDTVLYINEYNILNFWSDHDADVIEYKVFVDAIRDAGGQIDGIGLQAHIDRPNITKERVKRRLDILAAPMAPTANYPDGLPGLMLEITELDMSIDNSEFDNPSWRNATAQEQADVTENVLTASFEHPSVEGITIWGMNDFDHWRENSIMFDDLDDSGARIAPVLKPSGQVWIDYVMTDWWTDEDGVTDSAGNFTAAIFKGKHKITVSYDGVIQEFIQDITDTSTVTAFFKASAEDSTTYDEWDSYIDWEEVSDSEKSADPDGDGRNNWEEYVGNSDPLLKDSRILRDLYRDETGTPSIYFAQRSNSEDIEVSFYYSDDLSTWFAYPDEVLPDPVPELVIDEVSDADGITIYEVEISTTGFYRIRFSQLK